jgi:bacterioferritin-associated ferredoxin
MDRLPFRDAARGFRHTDVAAMLDRQMQLARHDPEAALELLDATSFEESEPGLDREQVRAWVEAQRAWLIDRTHAPNHVEAAVHAFATAIDDLKQAVGLDARAAERRAAAAAFEAEQRCASLIAEAERRLAQKLAQSRRKMREEAERIRREAIDDADRILERAGGVAARLLIDAEERERSAAEAVAQSRALQAELLNGIDAAQATVRARRPKAA